MIGHRFAGIRAGISMGNSAQMEAIVDTISIGSKVPGLLIEEH